LIQRTEARRWRVDQTLAEHFDCSQGSTPGRCKRWRLPQAALPRKAVGADEATSDVDRYYFTRAGSQLSKGLNEARTDPERELFGPDGDKFKALLAGETVYAELVGELREAVYVVDRVFAELKDTNGIPMRDRFDYELRGWIVGDELQLAARRDSAKALRVAAEHFAELHRRIHQAIRLNNARTSPDPALATKLASRHAELVHTFHGDDDQMLWWNTEMPALESAVYVPPAPTTVAPAAAPEVPGTAIAPPPADEPLANACCRKFDHEDGTAPVENPVGIPPWEATRRALRGRAFTTAEALVGAASLLTILASGMGAIYLTNDTFGSTANVVSAFLWGSTATTAVALLRRLLPGGLTTLKGS
jgi:hypothetical protein